MKISEFCIKRPVFAIVLSSLLVVLGVLSLLRLPVRGFPHVAKPVLAVITTYSGASAQVIENSITTPVENQLAGISGLENMRSYTEQGESRVILTFNPDVNIDSAADNVRSMLSGFFLKRLPDSVDPPVVQKRDPDREQSVVLSLSDSKINKMQLSDYANRYIVPAIQRNPGVSTVELWGFHNYAMRINLLPEKMAEHNVTVGDMSAILQAKNINVSGGEIKAPLQYFPVYAAGHLRSAKQFNDLVIRDQDGYLLRFRDVSKAEVAPDSTDSAMLIDGKSALGISVYTDSTANPITVAQDVRAQLKKLRAQLPSGMQINLLYDNSNFLQAALHNVYHDLFTALLLVVAVVWLFLGAWRAVFIPIILIPICLISVFSCLLIANMSINVFTLLALVLAIGLVVDDAIVVLENISRYVESGMSGMVAALKGSREIGPAVIAMTITLAAVYAPLGFTQHMSGLILREFAFTLALAVVISGFVALTLSPMMCAKLLKPSAKEPKYSARLKNFFARMQYFYQCLLRFLIWHKWWVAIILIGLLFLGGLCYWRLPTVLVPAEDMGALVFDVDTPSNSSFNYVHNYMRQINHVFADQPAIKHYLEMFDNSGAGGWLILKPYTDRNISAQKLAGKLSAQIKNIPGARLSVYSMGAIGGGHKGGSSIRLSILSDDDYAELYAKVAQLCAQISKWPIVQGVSQSLHMDDQQYRIKINQDLAATLKIDPATINATLSTMLGGSKITTFNWHARDYDVIMQAPQKQLHDLALLDQLNVRTDSGKMIPLSNLITVKSEIAAKSLLHIERQRADEITIQTKPGVAMGSAVDKLQHFMRQNLPSSYAMQFSGMARDLLQSRGTLGFIFGLAIVFIYLILAAQFESFIDPLIILFSVPLSIVGAIFTLWLMGGSVGIYAGIGLVTLVGLVAKHGILITNFANQLRAQGLSFTDALVQAASLRLRPILMTTAAMTVGALPLLWSHGANANGLRQIGAVLVGGLLIGTFFSLIVVPIAYSIIGRWRKVVAVETAD